MTASIMLYFQGKHTLSACGKTVMASPNSILILLERLEEERRSGSGNFWMKDKRNE